MGALLTGWDIGTLLNNVKTTLQTWGGGLFGVLGVVLIIWAVVILVKNFISKNQQPEWFKPIIMLIIGGALAIGGWSFVFNIAQGGKKTIDDLGSGATPTLLPFIGMFMH